MVDLFPEDSFPQSSTVTFCKLVSWHVLPLPGENARSCRCFTLKTVLLAAVDYIGAAII